ncbi:hypothetical protein JB92DRAFT_3034784 [Gautieria morchelliformis]|nr:hypothetical protein JB92DRAFT_3034784 [Gautieria morchelliformis]
MLAFEGHMRNQRTAPLQVVMAVIIDRACRNAISDRELIIMNSNSLSGPTCKSSRSVIHDEFLPGIRVSAFSRDARFIGVSGGTSALLCFLR